MKKIVFVVLILALVFLSLPLASQYRYSFPEYMENLQSKVPLKAIEWFEENAYSPTYGVSELIFAFYRGVSRYDSYVKYNGPVENLDKAAGDFKLALDIPYDIKYLYTDRALLYLAGILTISEGDKELASRIFKYYADNCEQFDPNYPTAIYWCLYLGYINKDTYNFYYEKLIKLNKNSIYDGPVIYDYFKGEYKSISEMLRRLDNANMNKNKRGRIPENADLFATIKNMIPIIPEDDKSTLGSTYQYLIFEEYPPKESVSSNLNIDSILSEYSDSKKRFDIKPIKTNEIFNNPNINIVETNKPARDTNFINTVIASGSESLNISVDKVANNNVRIDIAGRTFNTKTSTNFIIQLNQGDYDVLVSFLGKKYTNRVNVSKGAYNLLSIVVQDESIK